MAYTSVVELYEGIPLSIDSGETIYFGRTIDQDAYFASRQDLNLVFTANDFKFIRESGIIKISRNHDYLEKANYLRYKNGTKWYYAFITNVEYINDTTTAVYFVIDVMQTWLPIVDYELTECMVEREHSSTDEVGDNLIDEGLGVSDYLYGGENVHNSYQYNVIDPNVAVDNYLILGLLSDEGLAGYADGTFHGYVMTVWNIESAGGDLQAFLELLSTTPEKVVVMFMLPKRILSSVALTQQNFTLTDKDGHSVIFTNIPTLPNGTTGISEEINTGLTCGTDIDGYTVKNKKLLTYPYNFLTVFNNTGEQRQFRFEFLQDKTNGAKFIVQSTVTAPFKISLRPERYKSFRPYNETENKLGYLPSELIIENTPVCAWANNQFQAWYQTQGKYTIAGEGLSAIAGGAQIGGLLNSSWAYTAPHVSEEIPTSVLTGNGEIGVASSVVRDAGTLAVANPAVIGAVAATIGAKILVDSVNILKEYNYAKLHDLGLHGNAQSVSIDYAQKNIGFYFKRTYITSEWAEKLDNFFTAYGYATKQIKVPNINVRTRFTYTKTIGANFYNKDVPALFMYEINKRFNNGIRFWKSADGIQEHNLTRENAIPTP